jgi:hypothetical protein
MHRKLLLTLLFAAVQPAALSAQSREYATLQENLARTTSIAELRQREVTLEASTAPDPVGRLMERGFVLIRLYELTRDADDADEARDAFEKAVEREPAQPWAHFGLGLALSRVPEREKMRGFVLDQSIAELTGRDSRSRAGRAFLRSLELDPGFDRAAVEVASLALESRDRTVLEGTRNALDRIVRSEQGGPDAALALARVETALGNLAAADDAASRAGGTGADAALALHASAAALLRDSATMQRGAASYFEGIQRLTDAAAADYFAALSLIVAHDEKARWEIADLEGRKDWLRRFWSVRAARAGVTEAERLSEHYRRLAGAHERFRRIGKRGSAPGGALLREEARQRELPFDDRGIILIRYGDPIETVRTTSSELRPNETWVYPLPNGKFQLFHFVVLRSGPDFRLVDDILLAADPTVMGIPVEAMTRLLEDRARWDHSYKQIAMRIESSQRMGRLAQDLARAGWDPDRVSEAAIDRAEGAGAARERVSMETRSTTLTALEHDSDRPRFAAELPFYYDLYTFRGEANTAVTAAVAVPGQALVPRTVAGSTVYSIALSLIVLDTATQRVSRTDTTVHLRAARELQQGEHVRIHLDLAAPPSTTAVHRMVLRDAAEPSHGRLYAGSVTLPDYRGTALTLSDIVLAEPEGGTWRRGDVQLGLVPPRQFAENSALTVFYEVYNLPENAPYRTEIELKPTDGSGLFGGIRKLFGGKNGLTLRFEGVARPGANGVQEVRRVTPSLPAGRYEIRVNVTNLATGATATRQTRFIVLD